MDFDPNNINSLDQFVDSGKASLCVKPCASILLALYHCILKEPNDIVTVTIPVLNMKTVRLLECQKSGFLRKRFRDKIFMQKVHWGVSSRLNSGGQEGSCVGWRE